MPLERAGEANEFERVALPHVHSLYNVALKLTRRAPDAEDLVQETLLRAYRFFDTYEPGTNIRAWLFKIMRNLFINTYRKDAREPESVDFGGVEASLEALVQRRSADRIGPGTPEEILLSGALDEEVERALAELPEEYRMVLLLSSVEDLAYKEIAGILSIPIGTVMSRLHRARRLMQSKLMEYARARGLLDDASDGKDNVLRLDSFRGTRKA